MPVRLHSSEVEELREQLELIRFADDLLEECVRDRLSLRRSLEAFLGPVARKLGAVGAAVLTTDEELNPAAFSFGELGGEDAWTLLKGRGAGLHRIGNLYLVAQPLDVAGVQVGEAGFVFADDLSQCEEVVRTRVDCICEELDAILSTVHTASAKQDLVLRISRALSNRVFEKGLDEAVEVLHGAIGFRDLLFVWRDVIVEEKLFYRLYRGGRPAFDSEGTRHPGLESAIAAHGVKLLDPSPNRLRAVMGMDGALETLLVSGATATEFLGKVVVRGSEGGFSTFALDLVRLLGEKARDRLLDYNRERRHLSQFFPSRVIDQLLREPAYAEKYLRPREERVAILYADINSFTKISEQVLENPTLIGAFVDRWSAGAVDILWKHGGMFDKMVGDCIIGIFGPPFYAEAPESRAAAALRAAREILDFTIRFESDETCRRIRDHQHLVPGLGVAVGVNLCAAAVGEFGPNHDMTAFSSGMNATARLQSLAGFREIRVMDSVIEALQGLPEAKEFTFGALEETPVKNVKKPLRHAALR